MGGMRGRLLVSTVVILAVQCSSEDEPAAPRRASGDGHAEPPAAVVPHAPVDPHAPVVPHAPVDPHAPVVPHGPVVGGSSVKSSASHSGSGSASASHSASLSGSGSGSGSGSHSGSGHGSGSHHGSGGSGSHSGHHGHAYDFEQIMLFGGGLIFMSVLYGMASKHGCNKVIEGISGYTYKWMSKTMALFIASLLSVHYSQGLDSLQEWQMSRVDVTSAASIALVIAGLVAFVISTLVATLVTFVAITCCFRCCLTAAEGMLAILQLIVGYCIAIVVTYVTLGFIPLAVSNDNVWTIILVIPAWAVCLAIIAGIIWCMNQALQRFYWDTLEDEADDGIIKKRGKEHTGEFLNKAVSLGAALSLAHILVYYCYGIKTGNCCKKSKAEVKYLVGSIVFAILALVAGLMGTFIGCAQHLTGRESKLGNCIVHVRDTSDNFLVFLPAYMWMMLICMYLYNDPAMYNKDTKSSSVFIHVTISFVLTMIGLSVVPIIALCPYGKIIRRVFGHFIEIMITVAAFSWEQSVDALIAQARTLDYDENLDARLPFPTGNHFGTVLATLFILTLVGLLVPLFVCGIYPKTKDSHSRNMLREIKMNKELKKYTQLSDSEEERDDPYESGHMVMTHFGRHPDDELQYLSEEEE